MTAAPAADLTREIATVRRHWPGLPGPAPRLSPHIARSQGFLESLARDWAGGVYALFEEMEEKDPHLFSLLQTRKNGLLARPRRLSPASADGAQAVHWVEELLAGLPDFEAALAHLLNALAQGMAVLEILWGFDRRGRVVPVALRPRHPGRFHLDDRGRLLLAEPGGVSDGAEPGRAPGRALPERKFLLMRFGASDERPYGRGLCERVYWYWWFKKTNLKFWVMYNEKFGAPTVVARHQPGLSSVEHQRLLDVVASLQADAGVTLPEGIELSLLESNRRGSAETYRQLAEWCNAEMSRAVLGQTLTVAEGARSGSLALGRVHEAVRWDYVRADACLLAEVINGQLIRWIMDFNFGEASPAPRWSVDLAPERDLEVEATIDRQLLQMGVALPLRYFYEKYGRPAPTEAERRLRYDDSNLYQYHLQFGVLTVNEVRASLGLPPVVWGERPPSPANVRSASPALPPSDVAGDGPASRDDETRRELAAEDEPAEEGGR